MRGRGVMLDMSESKRDESATDSVGLSQETAELVMNELMNAASDDSER